MPFGVDTSTYIWRAQRRPRSRRSASLTPEVTNAPKPLGDRPGYPLVLSFASIGRLVVVPVAHVADARSVLAPRSVSPPARSPPMGRCERRVRSAPSRRGRGIGVRRVDRSRLRRQPALDVVAMAAAVMALEVARGHRGVWGGAILVGGRRPPALDVRGPVPRCARRHRSAPVGPLPPPSRRPSHRVALARLVTMLVIGTALGVIALLLRGAPASAQPARGRSRPEPGPAERVELASPRPRPTGHPPARRHRVGLSLVAGVASAGPPGCSWRIWSSLARRQPRWAGSSSICRCRRTAGPDSPSRSRRRSCSARSRRRLGSSGPVGGGSASSPHRGARCAPSVSIGAGATVWWRPRSHPGRSGVRATRHPVLLPRVDPAPDPRRDPHPRVQATRAFQPRLGGPPGGTAAVLRWCPPGSTCGPPISGSHPIARERPGTVVVSLDAFREPVDVGIRSARASASSRSEPSGRRDRRSPLVRHRRSSSRSRWSCC